MNPQATEKTVIITENNSNKFKTNGTVLMDEGYTVLYKTTLTDKELPPVSKGDTKTLSKTSTLSKKTSPPSKHTDSSLIEAMVNVAKLIDDEELKNVMKEAKGIGTEATRADIVEKLIKNGYMTRKGRGKTKHIEATDYGISIIEGLRGQDIISPTLAAEWESKLSSIEACTYEPKDFEKEMKEYIKTTTEEMKKMSVNIEGTNGSRKFAEELDITCPKCGKYKLIENGKAFGCSSYKNEADKCGFTIWKESTYNPGIVITKNELEALVKGEEVLGGVKLDENFKVVYPKSSSSTAVGTCPVCGKEILENSKAFGCSGYKDKSCSFTIWKNSNGIELNKEDVKEILAGQTVKGAKLENGKLVYAPKASVGKCPKCGKEIAENSKAFGCVGYRDGSCNFAIWKEIAGTKITEEDVKALLNGETTKPKTFKKKNGAGTFNAGLALEDGKVSFKF
jgi:DNA topoisomerase-3